MLLVAAVGLYVGAFKLFYEVPRLMFKDNYVIGVIHLLVFFALSVSYHAYSIGILRLRELIVVPHGDGYVVIAGNQRLEAAKAVGMTALPCKVLPSDTDPAKLREYAIKDNLPFGEDDWEVIVSDWDTAELEEWGMSVPEEWKANPDDFGEDFTLPKGEKGFAMMTFTLSNEQQRIIEQAIKDAKRMEEYNYVETFGNTNSNGNALYLIVKQWADARK